MKSLRRLLAAALLCALIPAAAHAQTEAKPGPFEAEITAFEKKDMVHPPAAGGVVFVGSSSFRMWKNLETAFPGVPVINRGFGGSELSDSVKYVHRIVTPYRPAMVVVYAGDNDISAGKSPETVCADFQKLVEEIHSDLPQTHIAFLSIKPSIARWKLVDKMKEANQLIQSFIKKHAGRDHLLEYIDIFPAMLNEEGEPRPELFKSDGLHPTDECYRLWQKIIAPHLKRYKTASAGGAKADA